MNGSQSSRSTEPEKASPLAAITFIVIIGIFPALFIWNHYFKRPVANGPHEQALVAAIKSRDVAAARAAIAAGASVTEPLPMVEDTFENRRNGMVGGNFNSAPWAIVREMVGMTFTGPGGADRKKLEEIARAIFEAGGDPNLSVSGNRASDRLHLIEDAVSHGGPELIQILIDRGLDLKGDGVGEALLSACGGQRDDRSDAVALTLIRAGANVNYRTRHGDTPLSAAISSKRSTVIDALKRAGAS